jgi:UDP-N-acetylglucosamine 2-epimerase
MKQKWVELVHNKVNYLAGAEKSNILSAFKEVRGRDIEFVDGLYGDANAAGKVVDFLISKTLND